MTTNITKLTPIKMAVVDAVVAEVAVKNKVGFTSVTSVLFSNIEVFIIVTEVVSIGVDASEVVSAVTIKYLLLHIILSHTVLTRLKFLVKVRVFPIHNGH